MESARCIACTRVAAPDVAIRNVAFGARDDPAMRSGSRADPPRRRTVTPQDPRDLRRSANTTVSVRCVQLLERDTLRASPRNVTVPLSTALHYAFQVGAASRRHTTAASFIAIEAGEHLVTPRRAGEAPRFRTGRRIRGRAGDEATRPQEPKPAWCSGQQATCRRNRPAVSTSTRAPSIFSFGCMCTRCRRRRAFAASAGSTHSTRCSRSIRRISEPAQRHGATAQPRGPALPGEGTGEPFQTARNLVFALETWLRDRNRRRRPRRRLRRARPRTVVAIVATVALLAVGAASWWTERRDPAPQDAASQIQVAEDAGGAWPCCGRDISGSSDGSSAGHDERSPASYRSSVRSA